MLSFISDVKINELGELTWLFRKLPLLFCIGILRAWTVYDGEWMCRERISPNPSC